MDLSKFCPACGRETSELYGDSKKLCAECFTDRNNLADLPRETEIVKCTVCGRMRKGRNWIEAYSIEDQLAETFSDMVEGLEFELQYWEEDEEFYVRVHMRDEALEDHGDVKIDWVNEQCPDCSRFQGGFYKAKIQLRGENLEEASDFIVDKAAELTNRNRKDFLSNIEQNSHGIDFYLSTEAMNKKILSELRQAFDPEIKRSYELIGEKDGQRVYRNVVSVRLPSK